MDASADLCFHGFLNDTKDVWDGIALMRWDKSLGPEAEGRSAICLSNPSASGEDSFWSKTRSMFEFPSAEMTDSHGCL